MAKANTSLPLMNLLLDEGNFNPANLILRIQSCEFNPAKNMGTV